ncbi:unnamed protein product [Parnassius apollo]|uniref:(apollo) hypothetical protein n=1 Tax=Parnassius apollo TaxID=110799 RepID=A0A8S3WJS8_PARAO|nr:unnamed protein product [Parnassius apollo]
MSELADVLPTEDLTMYTIWAKYKHLCAVTVSESNTKAVTNKKDDRPSIEQNTTRMITVSEQTTSPEIVLLISVPPVECHDDNSTTSARSSAETLQNKDVFGPTNNSKIERGSEKCGTKQNQDLLSKCAIGDLTSAHKTPTSHTFDIFCYCKPTQKKRKISKEKIPSAITSKSWREFYAKKDAEKKKEKEDIKAKRKQLRKEKKELKEKAIIEKQKNTSKHKENMKKRRHVSITSSESDVVSDVTYAETGGSEMDTPDESDEDLTLMDLKLKNTMNENGNNNQRQSDIQGDSISLPLSLEQADAKTSDEDIVSPKVIVEQLPYNFSVTSDENLNEKLRCGIPKGNNTSVSCNVSANDYVIVIWNERKYPGQIVSVTEEGALVSCLKKSKEFWRWPVIKDLQLYSWDSVVCQIAIPKFAIKGCFIIPEMDNV